MFDNLKVVQALNAALDYVNTELNAELDKPCFQLRFATSNDIEACKIIHQYIWKLDHVDLGNANVYQASLQDDHSAIIVAVSPDNSIIGAVCFHQSKKHLNWEIDVLSSAPYRRHEGPIGTVLCCAVLKTLKILEVSSVSLQASIVVRTPSNKSDFNQKLFDWYKEKFGFRIDEPVFQKLLHTEKIADIVAKFELSTIRMIHDHIETLKLKSILKEAIDKKRASSNKNRENIIESVFIPISTLIEQFKGEHLSAHPQRGCICVLFSKLSIKHKGKSKKNMQSEAIEKIESLVENALQFPERILELRESLTPYGHHQDSDIQKMCQYIIDRYLPEPEMENKKHKKRELLETK